MAFSSNWVMIEDGIYTPNLNENWRCVHRSYGDSRSDRPKIPIPNLSIFEIPISKFEAEEYHYRMKPFGVIDFETWRNFDNPNMASFLFYRGVHKHDQNKTKYENLSKEYLRSGMKIVEPDPGMDIPRNKNGWPLQWERDQTKKKGKGYGSYRKAEATHIQLAIGWLWDDEVKDNWPRLCEQMKAKRIYAHNATVDIIALMSCLCPDLDHPLLHFLSEDKDERTKILFKGSGILSAKFDLAPHLDPNYSRWGWDYKQKKDREYNDYEIEIRDSLALLTVGLGALGQSVGYEKTETPEIFTNDKHPDFGNYMAIETDHVRYAIDDCLILWRSIFELWNMVKELGYHGRDIPLTIGSLGFQMIANDNKDTHLVKKIKKSWKYETVHNRPDLDTILRETLTGGRVQVFDNKPFEGLSCGIDARSMYPSVQQLNDRWPDFGKLKAVLFGKGCTVDQVIEKEGGIHVHWLRPGSDQLGAVASRDPKTGNLVWSEKEGTRWLTMAKARFLLKRGYTLTPVPYVYERTTAKFDEETGETGEHIESNAIYAIVCPKLKFNPFTEVKNWYDKRLKMKDQGDSRQLLCKILMNSGSFGKWVENNQDIRIATEADAHFEFDSWEFNAVQSFGGEMVGYVKDPVIKRAKNTANILGAYITDYARIQLLEMADRFDPGQIMYCDTDSLKVKHSVEEVKQIVPDHLIGREMGQWGYENEHDFFHALKPKQYKAHYISKEDSRTGDLIPCDIWKLRIKGVNIKGVIMKMWRDEFTLGRPTDDFTLEVLKNLKLSDRMEYDRLIGIRESFRKGSTAGAWIVQSKQLRQVS